MEQDYFVGKRVAFVVLYLFICPIVVFCFAGGGHGSYAPMAVLYSWGAMPWQCGLPVGNIFFFFALPSVYLMGMVRLNTIACQYKGGKFARIPSVVHTVGIVLCLLTMKHGHLNTPELLLTSIVISAPIALIYIVMDYKLAWRIAEFGYSQDREEVLEPE